MNKIILTSLVLLFSISLFAQNTQDPRAKKILDEVNQKYKQYKSFEAVYNYSLKSPVESMNFDEEGNVTMKGNKLHLERGDNELIISDGETVWVYNKKTNELTLYDYDPEELGIPTPSDVVDLYKEGYKYFLEETVKINGMPHQVIKLVPDLSPAERNKERVSYIKLFINQKDSSVSKWQIHERNGNDYFIKLKSFAPNVNVGDTKFTFDKNKYKVTDTIDNRD